VAGFCLAANAGFVNTATFIVWGRSVSSVTGATATLGAGAATGQADDVLQSAVSAATRKEGGGGGGGSGECSD
jgi:uncharacterized membrane protein YoaK (UPF0700 family)